MQNSIRHLELLWTESSFLSQKRVKHERIVVSTGRHSIGWQLHFVSILQRSIQSTSFLTRVAAYSIDRRIKRELINYYAWSARERQAQLGPRKRRLRRITITRASKPGIAHASIVINVAPRSFIVRHRIQLICTYGRIRPVTQAPSKVRVPLNQ